MITARQKNPFIVAPVLRNEKKEKNDKNKINWQIFIFIFTPKNAVWFELGKTEFC